MRTMPRIFIGLAVSLAQLVTTAALAQDSYDYRRNANFAGIRTFAFKATPPMDPVAEKTTTYDSPLVRERTNAAIAAQLESRGMRRVDENPDVYIVTRRTFRDGIQLLRRARLRVGSVCGDRIWRALLRWRLGGRTAERRRLCGAARHADG